MKRVVLIHWNDEEARPRLERLRKLGFEVEWIAPRGGRGLQPYIQNPPGAFLIDLTRIPSHGRAIGAFLRQRKATRGVPIVYMGGEPEKVERTRELLPDAIYLEWKEVPRLRREIAQAEARVTVVPKTFAEYSKVPLARKLGVGDGVAVVLIGVPDEVKDRLGMYEEASTGERVLFFARSMRELENGFDAAAARVKRGGGLWVMWPKKASGVGSDVTLPTVRALALDSGWVDYRICAVDETWSGMLFARKRKPKT
jgi:hypothetical protein